MIFGMRADGRTIHNAEVVSGASCDCICPSCERPLVARKGDHNAHRFGHLGKRGEDPCSSGPETAIHMLAEEILASALEMDLPRHVPVDEECREVIWAGGPYRFETAVCEKRLGAWWPTSS